MATFVPDAKTIIGLISCSLNPHFNTLQTDLSKLASLASLRIQSHNATFSAQSTPEYLLIIYSSNIVRLKGIILFSTVFSIRVLTTAWSQQMAYELNANVFQSFHV